MRLVKHESTNIICQSVINNAINLINNFTINSKFHSLNDLYLRDTFAKARNNCSNLAFKKLLITLQNYCRQHHCKIVETEYNKTIKIETSTLLTKLQYMKLYNEIDDICNRQIRKLYGNLIYYESSITDDNIFNDANATTNELNMIIMMYINNPIEPSTVKNVLERFIDKLNQLFYEVREMYANKIATLNSFRIISINNYDCKATAKIVLKNKINIKLELDCCSNKLSSYNKSNTTDSFQYIVLTVKNIRGLSQNLTKQDYDKLNMNKNNATLLSVIDNIIKFIESIA